MRKSIKRLTAAVLFMSITVSSTFFLTACKNNDVSKPNTSKNWINGWIKYLLF